MNRAHISALLLSSFCLLSCSDQNFRSSNQPPVELPLIQVVPGEVSALGFCGTRADASLVVSNIGWGSLEMGHVEIVGDGWTVGEVTLPASIGVDETLTIPLSTTGGEATLKIVSNDPNHDEVFVPLLSAPNTAPVVHMIEPYDGAVVDEGSNALHAMANDHEDADETLMLSWSVDPGGVIWEGSPDVTGDNQCIWDAGPIEGTQQLSLSATDSCGVVTTETISICRGHITTYQSMDASTWEFMGSAIWDVQEDWLQLTEANPLEPTVGAAFETAQAVTGRSVQIEFSFYIGDGTGADGFSLTALDTLRMDTDGDGQPNFLGGAGCAMGFGGNSNCTEALSNCPGCGPALPGWSLEVDTYHNPEDGIDPTPDDHLGFYFDGDLLNLVEWAALPEMEDTGWHQMSVNIEAPHLTVSIDGTVYIDADLAGHFDFPAYIGFTAGTGGMTNAHLIDALTVTESTCD